MDGWMVGWRSDVYWSGGVRDVYWSGGVRDVYWNGGVIRSGLEWRSKSLTIPLVRNGGIVKLGIVSINIISENEAYCPNIHR